MTDQSTNSNNMSVPQKEPAMSTAPSEQVTLKSQTELNSLSQATSSQLKSNLETQTVPNFLNLNLATRQKTILGQAVDLYASHNYRCNFPNKALLKQVGLADLMPPAVRAVACKGETYTRIANGGFYNSKNQYLPIVQSTEFQIQTVDDKYQLPENEFKSQEPTTEGQETPKHVQIANQLGICPDTLKVISNLKPTIPQRLIARHIQNATQSFKQSFPKKALTVQNQYTPLFLTYLFQHCNLHNSNDFPAKKEITAFFQSYKKQTESNENFDVDKLLAEANPDQNLKLDNKNILLSIKEQLTTKQKQNAKTIIKVFSNQGIHKNIIAAALVNAWHESGLNETIQSKCTDSQNNREQSFGLFQINAKARKKANNPTYIAKIKTAKGNCEEILKDINGGHGRKLKHAAAAGASVPELAAIFSRDIERPGDVVKGMRTRTKTARTFFDYSQTNLQENLSTV